jgi:hypothetical protein
MVKIKGKILVHRPLSVSNVGEKGFLPIDAFRVFDDQLYFNIFSSFFLKEIDPFKIPFERNANDETSFEFDFQNVDISFFASVSEPKKSFGWLGPFQFNKSDFTWQGFYEKMNYEDLFELYKTKLDAEEYKEAKVIVGVYKSKLNSYYKTLELTELREYQDFFVESKGELEEYYLTIEEEVRNEKYFDLLRGICDWEMELISFFIDIASSKLIKDITSIEELEALKDKCLAEENYESIKAINNQISFLKIN